MPPCVCIISVKLVKEHRGSDPNLALLDKFGDFWPFVAVHGPISLCGISADLA